MLNVVAVVNISARQAVVIGRNTQMQTVSGGSRSTFRARVSRLAYKWASGKNTPFGNVPRTGVTFCFSAAYHPFIKSIIAGRSPQLVKSISARGCL